MTGIDTGFKPQDPVNMLMQPGAWFNTGDAPIGMQNRRNPLVPLLTMGARYAGGDTFNPSEIANYAKAGALLGMSVTSNPADQSAQRMMNQVNKLHDATGATVDALKKQGQ